MNLYFDMDGVLVQYDKDAYKNEHAPGFLKGVHYFRELNPDEKMISVYQALRQEFDTHIISRIITNPSELCVEHMRDKIYWLVSHGIYEQDKTLFSLTDKPTCVVSCKQRLLTKEDILIDDFNENLWLWEKQGGTGVKYINGVNSPDSYHGVQIARDMSKQEILTIIQNIERNQTS